MWRQGVMWITTAHSFRLYHAFCCLLYPRWLAIQVVFTEWMEFPVWCHFDWLCVPVLAIHLILPIKSVYELVMFTCWKRLPVSLYIHFLCLPAGLFTRWLVCQLACLLTDAIYMLTAFPSWHSLEITKAVVDGDDGWWWMLMMVMMMMMMMIWCTYRQSFHYVRCVAVSYWQTDSFSVVTVYYKVCWDNSLIQIFYTPQNLCCLLIQVDTVTLACPGLWH